MRRNIYAFLVGIDKYPNGVRSLQGCVNDIEEIEVFLRTQLNLEKYQLHLKKLLNQNATRAAVIDGFKNYLCKAGNQDVAFFYYSGHGSNELAPAEFVSIEPNRQLETIVCYDSRLEEGFDLADKELAYLLFLAKNKPQFVLILDCCHSGSGFRDTLPQECIRQTPARETCRAMENFVFSVEEIKVVTNSLTSSHTRNLGSWLFPTGNNILLAACLDTELAREHKKKRRGMFSYFLLDTLEKTTSSLTYREVFDRTKALVRAHVKDQSPQLESTKPEFWDLPFLGFKGEAAISKRQHSAILSSENQDGNLRWFVNRGAIHSIPIRSTKPIRFEIYQLDNWGQSVGEVEVTEILPEKSIVKFLKSPENLSSETIFNAVINYLSIPAMNVFLDGDKAAFQFVERVLENTPSVKSITTSEEADYRLLAHNNQFSITLPYDDRPLVKQISGYGEDQAKLAVMQLEHITRWLIALKQENPVSSLPTNAVRMQIYRNGEELKESQFRLEYQRVGDVWKQPTIQIKLTNTTQQKLYCTLLNLTELYSISSPFFNHAGVWLDGGREIQVAFSDGEEFTTEIPFLLPRKLWKQGVTESLEQVFLSPGLLPG